MKYAILHNNMIADIKELTDEEVQSFVYTADVQQIVDITNDNPQPLIGWVFTGNSFRPPSGSLAKRNMKITKLAYRQRFTTAEMVDFYTKKATNPVLQLLSDNLNVASFIDLDRGDTVSGTMYLVQLNVITMERAQQILTAEPTALEIYTG